jgi:hypothetical protein
MASTIRLFADDCVIYRKIVNNKDTEKLQADLNRLGRGLLIASRGQFSDKGYVRVASRVVNPPDKGKYELRPAVSLKV